MHSISELADLARMKLGVMPLPTFGPTLTVQQADALVTQLRAG